MAKVNNVYCYYTLFLNRFFVCLCAVGVIAACGTQVGNPTENDGPPKNSSDKPAPGPTAENHASTASDFNNKICVISVTSQPLSPPESTGSLTIVFATGGEFTATITPPGLTSVKVKTLPLASTGIYKVTLTPSQGTTCSAELTIDSDLVQIAVSASITLP